MSIEPTAKIDELLRSDIAPFMKTQSFRRKGRHFWREHGRVIDVLNLQKSQWNDGREARFCINLGLVWPEVQAGIPGRFVSNPPSADNCTVRLRLGHLLTGKDYWWSVSDATPVEQLGAEIVQALTEHALPWMEKGHDPKVSCDHLEKFNGKSPLIPIFKKLYLS